ncbi:unnamed protein product [Adineta steineri]|uniref:Fucosyltransferase n=1 Tax=Adineta steineri TaxID=433720 RepID=A0A813X2G7_9BILA|nr:unnamed protein product [Adineta steineri]CAF0866797.1 unnamed protein product [Adineta steineri]
MTCIQINMTPVLLPYTNQEQQLVIFDLNVMYPIDVINNHIVNTSITYHLTKKNELKLIDDAKAVNKKHKIILPLIKHENDLNSHLIVGYTNVFSKPKFCSSTNEEIFGKTCPYTNCKYTCDRTQENTAQVLLMHKQDLDYEKLDSIKRDSDQIWLLWHDEPKENSTQLNKYKFNWTMSYRTSAEASLGAYGITIAKEKPWSIGKFNSWVNKQFNERHNQAVWFVSNCRPQKRLKKFHSLRQYFPISAFGRCIKSNESFSLHAQVLSKDKCNYQSTCERDYLSKSKFYLAFESQSCTDYITEKFWRTLKFGAIPIVSGPERENYVRIAPPNSFIHIDDYSSDDKLAKTLYSIATNRSLYEKYHYWRRYYDIYYEAKDLEPYRFCEICCRLNTNKQRIWYENINDWFLEKC